MGEFARLREAPDSELFKELCFCILTANYTAEGGMRMQREIGDGFLALPEEALAARLRSLGYRFPNVRSRYIVEARRHNDGLGKMLSSFGSQAELREWLVENVKGLGMKEASHFMRNVGFFDVAIIDFHIIDILARHGLAERPRSLTRKAYLRIEEKLREVAAGSA